jgi:hypothetical protein
MTAPATHRPPPPAPREGLPGWAARHPSGAFVALTYGISWPLFLAAALGGGAPLIVAGAFGPAASAAIVTRWTGGSARGASSARHRRRPPDARTYGPVGSAPRGGR